jgi:large subunit ribosomal protein L19
VRRAKLYYLRDRVGRRARVRERRFTGEDLSALPPEEAPQEAGAMPTDEDAARPGEEELAGAAEVEEADAPQEPDVPEAEGDPAEGDAAEPEAADEAEGSKPGGAE